MSLRGRAYIAGIYEHPSRHLPDTSTYQVYREVVMGALADAHLSIADVDGLFCDNDAGFAPWSLAEYLGLECSYYDSTDTGGSTYLAHVGHAAEAIAAGKCSIALICMAGRPRSERALVRPNVTPEFAFESLWGSFGPVSNYALAASRHMHEYGTTSRDLAEVKVAASIHAQYNPHALLKKRVTVDEVLDSPMVSSPLHVQDCCVVTDGGGAVVVVSPEIARSLNRTEAKLLGYGCYIRHSAHGRSDITQTGAAVSGPTAFAEAGIGPRDIAYASIYDSFTITVIESLEDLGFCEKGRGGDFVRDGTLVAPLGRLPINTDGGGLCNNHPSGRGGMTKIIEAVRQLRGQATPETQIPNCDLVLAHGTGGFLATRMASATVILGGHDA
jgi:acetyl-CoA C-acetyltransferase